jgi:hypothetical protein
MRKKKMRKRKKERDIWEKREKNVKIKNKVNSPVL